MQSVGTSAAALGNWGRRISRESNVPEAVAAPAKAPYLAFGAKPPEPKLIVTRGHSTRENPITSVSARAYAAANPPSIVTDLSTLCLIPFHEVKRRLLLLNPRMIFKDLGDGRTLIGVETPPQSFIGDWEGMDRWERQDYDLFRQGRAAGNVKGPRFWLAACSNNAVEPYNELVTRAKTEFVFSRDPAGGPDLVNVVRRAPRVICRSLRTIIQACVEGDAFTYEEAERIFAMPFKRRRSTVRLLNMTPEEFNGRQPLITSIGGV